MYSRSINKPPVAIVQKGKAHFGFFSPVPSRLDIRGIRAPFAGIPLPSFITNMRIKSRLAFVFSVGSYIGIAEFFDDKVFGLAELSFWNRDTGKRYTYHSFMLARRRFVPVKTEKAACTSFSRSRYVRIAWNRTHNRIALIFKFKGNSLYPPVNGYLFSSFSNPQLQEFCSVTPAPTTSRCSASWILNTPAHGSVSFLKGKKQEAIPMPDSEGLACMILNRMYYKFHTRSTMICGMGMIDGKKLICRFASTSVDAVNADDYNDNILTVNGQTTLIPPVCITHPFGVNAKWVIQDTESMVDLTFTPASVIQRNLSIVFVRTSYTSVYGTLNGVLLTASGEKLALKDFPGIVRQNMLRL